VKQENAVEKDIVELWDITTNTNENNKEKEMDENVNTNDCFGIVTVEYTLIECCNDDNDF